MNCKQKWRPPKKTPGCSIKRDCTHAFPSAVLLPSSCLPSASPSTAGKVCVRGVSTSQAAWLLIFCLSQKHRFPFYWQLGHFLFLHWKTVCSVRRKSLKYQRVFIWLWKKEGFWGIWGWTVTVLPSFWFILDEQHESKKCNLVSRWLIFTNVNFS